MIADRAIAAKPEGIAWHSQSANEALAHLGSAATGLSAQEAAKRLATSGPNELKEADPISPWVVFLGQFKSLPTDGRPVTSWPNRDEAWSNVASGIKAAAESVARRLAT